MKKHIILVILGGFLSLLSCKSEPTPTTGSSTPAKTVDAIPKKANKIAAVIPTSHDCVVRGKLIDDNDFWIPEEQLWICIVADDITRDQDFGESYRILDVYDTEKCSQIKRKVLPVNNSPDFPWYIFQNTYEEKNQVVCTSGFEFTFCYDVENRTLLPRMKPDYLLPRTSLDAQSGITQCMEVYDHYLFGHSQDLGFFAYDLNDKKEVKNFLPAAEYHAKKVNKFNSLFLVPVGNKKYQAVIPNLNLNNGKITITPLLKTPLVVDPLIAKNVQNNRFQIFTDLESPNGSKVAFDLQEKVLVNLPANVATLPVGKVLAYLKGQKK